MSHVVQFTLNGRPVSVAADPAARLIDILRESFGFSAAKAACRIGRCGACLVSLEGWPVNACLVMAWRLEGAAVLTPEAIAATPAGLAVGRAVAAECAFQCGYCAPGMAVAMAAIIEREPNPGRGAIDEALGGNLCRCSGYLSLVRATQAAARALHGGRAGASAPESAAAPAEPSIQAEVD